MQKHAFKRVEEIIMINAKQEKDYGCLHSAEGWINSEESRRYLFASAVRRRTQAGGAGVERRHWWSSCPLKSRRCCPLTYQRKGAGPCLQEPKVKCQKLRSFSKRQSDYMQRNMQYSLHMTCIFIM